MMNHLSGQTADLGILKVEIADEKGAGGDVDYGAGEAFVEGCVGGAVTVEAGAGGEGGGEGGAEG